MNRFKLRITQTSTKRMILQSCTMQESILTLLIKDYTKEDRANYCKASS